MGDLWRFHHENTRKYTWRRTNPFRQSRIDYVFLSSAMINNDVVKTKIESGILSDHSFVQAEIRLSAEKLGTGIWRFNNNLLEDFEFINLTRAEIRRAVEGSDIYAGEISRGLKVEMLLANIRAIAMKRGKKLAQSVRGAENDLFKKVNDLKQEIAASPNGRFTDEYNAAKHELNDLKMRRGKLAIIRSQASWLKDGENLLNVFFQACKTEGSREKHYCIAKIRWC